MTVSSSEFVGVLALRKKYLAVYFREGEMTVLSDCPLTDPKVAECAARTFAQQYSMRYEENVVTLRVPLITVLHYQQKWFPGIFDGRKFFIFKNRGSEMRKNKLQGAINTAKKLALKKKMSCVPSLGIILHTGRELILQGVAITDQNLGEHICRRLNARYVVIADSPITNFGLKNLNNLSKIRRLIFRNCPRITANGIRELSLPTLQHLEVTNCPLTTEKGLDELFENSKLLQLVSDREF